MVKITREECLRDFYPEGIPKHLLPPAKERAQERWALSLEEVLKIDAQSKRRVCELREEKLAAGASRILREAKGRR
jgi:hypothetical protein